MQNKTSIRQSMSSQAHFQQGAAAGICLANEFSGSFSTSLKGGWQGKFQLLAPAPPYYPFPRGKIHTIGWEATPPWVCGADPNPNPNPSYRCATRRGGWGATPPWVCGAATTRWPATHPLYNIAITSLSLFKNGAESGFEMCFDIGSQHLGCWSQRPQRPQPKNVSTPE